MPDICVFCGSSPGVRPAYARAAESLGAALVDAGRGLVFGGGRVGLMGRIADAVLARGGRVTGVVPRALVERELAHTGLDDLRVVETMHERKALMAELSEGFVALPGGFGTLEEIAEALTWTQLGIQPKPCGLLNVDGYFDGLLGFLDHVRDEGFLAPAHRAMLCVDTDPAALLAALDAFAPPDVDKAVEALRRSP